ncbi:carbohydrate ABC transporter permease [Anaerocolumna sp. MB42-C2]|uniref:carbohydrate ABC transporter permease n=1 Tax=Anaerocolumna sp. MB42-C2 TaxID=3070997 RepID=UPI0027E1C8C5|nr:carbohydrate ABC transporter permease [Anaerocolumna sp. MB42-C2]WMJ85854.1 carbohydrate ABC transporter permease [Anaerocolumna sp. MB42-C2]
MKAKRTVATLILLILFIVIGIIMIFPIYYLFMGSLQKSDTLFGSAMKLVYDSGIMDFNNYVSIFTYKGGIYLSWYKNSVLIAILFTVVSLFLSSMVGYGLGAYEFRFKNIIFVMVMLVMMIPLEILMLPLYKLIISFGIIDSYRGVILPFMVAPVAIFFFRQYVSGISKEFMEAARIDGCTEYGIFFKIISPVMKPAYGAMTILLAMQQWNSFMWPLIVLRSNEHFTLTIGIASLISPYSANYEVMYSGCILAILPILILFVFNQRYFISGLTAGGVKG